MNTLKVYLVMMSHLSDAQIEITCNPKQASTRLNFVKQLIIDYPDTQKEISEDELNKIWLQVVERENR